MKHKITPLITQLTILMIIVGALMPLNKVSARDHKGRFVIVIDAGHGGHDAGALGSFSKEKNINLKVALKAGRHIKKMCPSAVVLYTRTTDKFIGLNERADFANKHKADLFVSIHANSAGRQNSSARGTEIYVLGLARTKENLQVAMKENAVILKEDNYKVKYAGFNPNSTESYIIFQFMQNKDLEKSLEVAELVNTAFKGSKLANRGVKQAGFLVLRRTSMPSILVELGFITNKHEESYMNSNKGSDQLAKAIAGAVIGYKNKVESRRGQEQPSTSPAASKSDNDTSDAKGSDLVIEKSNQSDKTTNKPLKKEKLHYRIQIHADKRKLSRNHKVFKGYQKDLYIFKEDGLYKYTLYNTYDLNEAKRIRNMLSCSFKGCFIVIFDGSNKRGILL